MSFFCLITSDNEEGTAYEKFTHRVKDLTWPIYENTQNKKLLKENDQLIFYIAGQCDYRMHFLGTAKIKFLDKYYDDKEVLSSISIKLCDAKIFKKPVSLKETYKNLDFIKFKGNLGLNLQGGCKILTENDFNLITNLGSN